MAVRSMATPLLSRRRREELGRAGRIRGSVARAAAVIGPAAAGSRGFTQTDKTFGTKAMDVREDRAANKAAPVQGYAPFERAYLGRGKRQDTIDDLRNQKNMTIDQVRELLNKNK